MVKLYILYIINYMLYFYSVTIFYWSEYVLTEEVTFYFEQFIF